MFKPVDPKIQISKLEHEQIDYWKKHSIFEKSVKQREGKPKFVIFDGPPFANGLPHYGHILAQALKDAVTRYAVMKGYYVPRVNGWDCHGLPVEYEVEKNLGLSGRKDIEDLGVEKFNQHCRDSVFSYTEQWAWLFERVGRWVDTENGYATLEPNYMESIWWVFKQIWEKGLVYQGHKSMHICPRCVTPLSNFEVSQGYADVTDLSATVMFRSKKDPNRYFLAWTTTPWTLPGNTALAVNPEVTYVQVEKDGRSYVLAEDRLASLMDLDGVTIEGKFHGKDLVGETYEPLFDYYVGAQLAGIEKAWQVLAADFVTTEDGTGIVHIAGGYGEDDMNLVQANGLPIIQHVSMDGTFKPEITEWAGKFVKGQDHNIAEALAQRGLLFKKENYKHSYPHCWRCDTPLLNFATHAWFIRVTEIKDQMIKNNAKIHWQPEHIQEGRFGKWLENVRDWNISRNRFWGCPIPIWICDTCGSNECIPSLEELKKRSGKLPQKDGELDLHRPYIDEVDFACEKCDGTMKRIPEVLDCWFESGAMPYAQLHYPFENKEEFEANFPAHFIAEGLDQTRGWFYTLHVLSTILFDEPAFKNVIVNGILLAADGEKLSKRKKNYPDPKALFEEKGVDSMRLFLYTTPAPLAENVRFSEQHVEDLLKKFTLTLWNTYSFFVTYASIDGFEPQAKAKAPSHKLDQWILSELNALIKEMTEQMDEYNLTKATRPLLQFVDLLSNWYIRRSRRRFWKSGDDADKTEAYQTLHTVLVTLSKLLAPFMPFISEAMYTNLTGELSVHLTDWPTWDEELIDTELNLEIDAVRQVVALGHAARAKKKIRVRQPLQKVSLALPKSIAKNIIVAQKDVILEELNVKEMEILDEAEEIALPTVQPNAKLLGPKYGSEVQKIIQAAKAGEFTLLESGQVQVGSFLLESEEVELAFRGKEGMEIETAKGIVLALNTEITDDLYKEGLVREVIRAIQDCRKEADYNVSDRIQLSIVAAGELKDAIVIHSDWIQSETLAQELRMEALNETDLEKEVDIDGSSAKIAVRRFS